MSTLREIEQAIRRLPAPEIVALRNWIDALAVDESTALDQVHFRLSPEEWDAFCARLDEPVAANPQLRRTMTTPFPWAN